MQNNPTTASLPPQFEHFASVASSTPASLDQAANPRRSPGMEGAHDDNCPRPKLEAKESAAKPGIEAMDREAMVRKKKREMKYEGPGALGGRCSQGTEDSPGREEKLMESKIMDYEGAAEFLESLLRKKEMNCGPVIANRPNPPCANQKRKVQANDAPDSAEKQTDAPVWSEIIMGGMDFDVKFRRGVMILSTPVATDCAGAPRPSKKKMPKKKDADTPEEVTPSLRS